MAINGIYLKTVIHINAFKSESITTVLILIYIISISYFIALLMYLLNLQYHNFADLKGSKRGLVTDIAILSIIVIFIHSFVMILCYFEESYTRNYKA